MFYLIKKAKEQKNSILLSSIVSEKKLQANFKLIHQLHLCRGVRPNECPDMTQQSDGEAPVLEL